MLKYSNVTRALSAPVEPELLATRKQGGVELTYIPWHHAANILDEVCDRYETTWDWLINSVEELAGGKCIVIGTLTIEGVSRSATGIEESEGVKFGDPTSNASSMAFRRACALHGLGRYLYEKEKVAPAKAAVPYTPKNNYAAAPVAYKPRQSVRPTIKYEE